MFLLGFDYFFAAILNLRLVLRPELAAVGGKFDLDEISSLLKLLSENDVTEFKLERESDRLWLKRGGPEIQQVVTYAPAPVHHGVTEVPTMAQPVPVALSTPAAAPVAIKANFHEVKSPMVGTFYRRPAVDAEPFVKVGESVKKGDVLCIVEAMKLMNEIECDVSGKIAEVCLEDGQMAEYGEVLFRIEPMAH